MRKYWIKVTSFVLALLVLAGVILPFANAQSSSQSNQNQSNVNSTSILINITEKAINFAKSKGINTSLAESYYQQALSYYKQGNYTGAQIYLHLAMKVLAKEMESKPTTPIPNAIGIKMQLILIEKYVNSSKIFNNTFKEMIINQVNDSLNYLNQGNVPKAAQMLALIKKELMQVSISISNIAKQRVSHSIIKKVHHDVNQLNNIFMTELGNATSEFNYNLNETPILTLVERSLENNTNISVETYAHLLIALNNLENIMANKNISFVFNFTGRSKELWPLLFQLNRINDTLNAISLATSNTNISKAVSLMKESINETWYSIKEWYVGNDTIALNLINESIQNDMMAQSYLTNDMMGNGLLGISNRIYHLDLMVYNVINSSIIIGKKVEIIGFVIWNISSNSYLIVGHIISLGNYRGFMPVEEHMWQLMIVNTTNSTQINGTIYPNSLVKINGIISGKYYSIYIVNASQIIVLNEFMQNITS
ncbi:hypothetical protein Calag_1235 [Caldisphaera lagunensis DSM 15908]|uniref:Uncharacterized protein n=1 Tax=Caldisphaera lagunensis (strain DSM 15908 / JCM 11604 / ANMR 0165 / IC-154) TaxID=1056495 RepID=L0ACT0_CALLD|nr:hypothetical protein [Caldisphaera lagunensis]AFZ70952.1 hypothetical protein Calag_1235 [Caldisphaera lagunensis DSM 15908]